MLRLYISYYALRYVKILGLLEYNRPRAILCLICELCERFLYSSIAPKSNGNQCSKQYALLAPINRNTIRYIVTTHLLNDS
jgi:hypothetical protein